MTSMLSGEVHDTKQTYIVNVGAGALQSENQQPNLKAASGAFEDGKSDLSQGGAGTAIRLL